MSVALSPTQRLLARLAREAGLSLSVRPCHDPNALTLGSFSLTPRRPHLELRVRDDGALQAELWSSDDGDRSCARTVLEFQDPDLVGRLVRYLWACFDAPDVVTTGRVGHAGRSAGERRASWSSR